MKKLFAFFTFALLIIWCVTITSCGKDEEIQVPETEQSDNDQDADSETESDPNPDPTPEPETDPTPDPEPGTDTTLGLVYQLSYYDGYVLTFEYDDNNCITKMTASDSYESETCTFTYSDSKISSTYVYAGDYNESATFEAVLNTDNTMDYLAISSAYTEGSYTEKYTEKYEYTYSNALLSNFKIYEDGSYYKTKNCIWSDGNMTKLGDDIFEYSSSLNQYSIDLNMFITNSEELDYLYGPLFGFLMEIEGIHSKNMISQCTEEGYTYDITYTTDSDDLITSVKWDKYNNGNGRGFDVIYY